jgi:hypothetical protein
MKYAIFWWSSAIMGAGTLYTIIGKPKFITFAYALCNQKDLKTGQKIFGV